MTATNNVTQIGAKSNGAWTGMGRWLQPSTSVRQPHSNSEEGSTWRAIGSSGSAASQRVKKRVHNPKILAQRVERETWDLGGESPESFHAKSIL